MPVLIQKVVDREIPSDAVIISREEALSKQWDMLYDWKKWSEVWPLKRGFAVVSGVTAITSMMFTNHYRRRLKLANYGMVPMYLPTVFMPSIGSAMFHKHGVTDAVLLQSECPVCIQGRAILSQLFFSIAVPMFLAPLGSCYYAMSTASYDVPPLQFKYLPELGRLWLSMTQRLKLKLPILIGTNILTAAVITYLEEDCFFKLNRKLYDLEEELRNKLSKKS